ncbi:MAG: phosphomannomutase/phosphoglucomutase [Thiotrichales bacterium]
MTAAPPSLEIFGRYDIRGIAGVTLTAAHMRTLGRAFAAALRDASQRAVVVARDARISSPELAGALIEALLDSGIDVVDLGSVPTPLAYFASEHLLIPNTAVVTASHNPTEYNGLKLTLKGRPVHGEQLRALYFRIARTAFSYGNGQLTYADVGAQYLRRVSRDIAPGRTLHIAVDCGHGVAGVLAPTLLRTLGCEVTELFCEPDGHFPGHHPDPAQPANLRALQYTVTEQGLDLGIAFDGDGDRLGVVDNHGKIIWPDRLMMLFSREILRRRPGSQIIFDVKSSNLLGRYIAASGGVPVMYQSGYTLLREKLMAEPSAVLAGELSGHLFFKDRWYGFDDAIYSAARLIELLGRDPRTSAEVFAELPEALATPELRLPFESLAAAHEFMRLLMLRRSEFRNGRVNSIDGLRIDYPDGWGLVRASNTTPNLTLRFEAESTSALTRIENMFRRQLLALDPTLELPF